jgi:hypothetical protein
VIFRSPTPFSPSELHQAYVNSSKEKRRAKKRYHQHVCSLEKLKEPPPKERPRANGKSSFLRNSCFVCLYRQITRTARELDYVKCEKRAGSETK